MPTERIKLELFLLAVFRPDMPFQSMIITKRTEAERADDCSRHGCPIR